jgi:hypothetical protein
VSDSLPSQIACEGTLPSSCPPDNQCVAGLCVKSVPGVDAGRVDGTRLDAGSDVAHFSFDSGRDVAMPPHDSAPHGDAHDAMMVVVVDSGHDVAMPMTGALGDTCQPSMSNCASGFCIDTMDLPGLSFGAGYVCSATCCADSDCGSGGVCYPTVGGNYCITATVAARCGSSCGTACCSDSTCTGGTYCAPGSASAAQGSSVPECRAPDAGAECLEDPDCTGGSSDPDNDCYADTDCNEGVCFDPLTGDYCDPASEDACECYPASPCCSPSDCTEHDESCQWQATTTRTFRACGEKQGDTPSNESCSGNTLEGNAECVGGICAPVSAGQNVCTQPCCQDSDCTAVDPTWVCRPVSLTILGNGSQDLLVCQPPSSTVN